MGWEREISKLIEREGEIVDDSFFDSILGLVEDHPTEPLAPKRRGRPKGVKEEKPRKRKIDLEKIIRRLDEAIENLRG